MPLNVTLYKDRCVSDGPHLLFGITRRISFGVLAISHSKDHTRILLNPPSPEKQKIYNTIRF